MNNNKKKAMNIEAGFFLYSSEGEEEKTAPETFNNNLWEQ